MEASRSEYLSIIQVTGDYVLSTDDPDGLFFDPSKFRANKEVNLKQPLTFLPKRVPFLFVLYIIKSLNFIF